MMTKAREDRQSRLLAKVAEKAQAETVEELRRLKTREDRLAGYDYFLNLMEEGLSSTVVAERTGRPAVNLLCLQAPLELIHAAGFQPFKIFGGSLAASQSVAGVPALMCPMLRSVTGLMSLNQGAPAAWVLPTTCDWVVNFAKTLEYLGQKPEGDWHWLELPHFKEAPGSQKFWLEAVYDLKRFLETLINRRIRRQDLAVSIQIYQKVWRVFSRLSQRKREGQIAFPWFLLIANTFFLDDPERWTEALELLLAEMKTETKDGGRVFLAGSPIFFPNFKLPHLLEEAGLIVVADDLCSSERLLPGAVSYSDTSEFGLMEALAQRYHQGCLCPTFADNDRRVNNILGPAAEGCFDGVVFQVLKGCHPYDLESYALEARLKDRGLKYIRLETDYAAEDRQNLLTRLEAFRRTLGEKKA